MNLSLKKIKLLIFALIISSIVSFILCILYPVKDRIFFSLKSVFLKTPNIGYYNYEKHNDEFVVVGSEHFLYLDNIDSFVGNIEVNFKKFVDKEIKVFVHDIDSDKSLLIFNAKNKNFKSFNIEINRNIKCFIMVIESEIGESFYFDSITCNNNTFYFTNIKIHDLFSQISYINFWVRYLILFLFLMFVSLHFILNIEELYNRIYKYRYYISFGIIIFVIAFELNNTSMDFWRFSDQPSDIIFGKTRLTRSDEYLTYTPMLLSQDPDYNYFSDVLRGTKTDMFMIYGQPVKNVVCIFRPFLLGFLFLGSAKGLSFLWILKLVLLFLITFEFLLLITRKNKKLSFVGSVLITFAPVVQWWWTPSGIVEIIIYGELLVVLLNNYLLQKKFIIRILELFTISVLIGSYILVLYPAWQVPFAYIFSFSFLGICLENCNKYKFHKKDIIFILSCMILLLFAAIYIYYKSKETIDIIINTAYPGLRFEMGGDSSFVDFFKYWGNLFFAFSEQNLKTNVCEFSSFFDFFPIGLILSFAVLFKDKIKDKFLIILLLLDLFFILWCIIGCSEIVAKITMLRVSSTIRIVAILGYLNILILLRSLILQKYKFSVLNSVIISFVVTFLIVYSNIIFYKTYFDILKISITAVMCFILLYIILRNKINKFFIILITLMMFVAGALVNPIQKGINVVRNFELYKVIKNINTQDRGIWITEGDNVMFGFRNLPIMVGASSFNSTNTYPNLQVFKNLDKENKYNKIYNRYAHIYINLVKDNDTEKFSLGQEDVVIINLTVEDVGNLGIKYILTRRKLEDFGNDRILFEQIFYTYKDDLDFYIYKIKDIKKEEERK